MKMNNSQKEWSTNEIVSLFIFIILMFLGIDQFWYQGMIDSVIERNERGVLMARDALGVAVLSIVHEYRYHAVVLLLILIVWWIYLKLKTKGGD